MKRAILFFVCLMGMTFAFAQIEDQEPPHTLHVGAGYSYILSDINAGGANVDKLKHGAGLELSYSYLPIGKRMGFGVNYTGHLSRMTVVNGPSWRPDWTNINMQVHNITPMVNICNLYEKHAWKTSLGLGYMIAQFGGTMNSMTGENPKETKGGLSTYLSFEYEYRIDKYTGLFLRIHRMTWTGKYDKDRETSEGIADIGISTGFNLHF